MFVRKKNTRCLPQSFLCSVLRGQEDVLGGGAGWGGGWEGRPGALFGPSQTTPVCGGWVLSTVLLAAFTFADAGTSFRGIDLPK